MIKSVIFDVDGTLVDSVDLHARAWQEAFEKFGHSVTFQQARSQIGKGGDQLLPVFLSDDERAHHGDALEAWRGDLFKSKYLGLVRPFSAVPALLQRLKEQGVTIAVASSAKKSELDVYLEIADIKSLVDVSTSSDDAEHSKPAPDIFQVALAKLCVEAGEAVAIGDAPYDAEAAGKAGISTIGFLCGGFPEASLLKAGCVAVYQGPSGLLACYEKSPFSTHASMVGEASPDTKAGASSSKLIQQSSNGDSWHFIGAVGTQHPIVRHIANASSGGQVTDMDVEAFLSANGSSPEASELRRMLTGIPKE
ncbi:HAD family hydrolase [Acidisoma silvae]|uniref:HAD family hydrolase n=1 Tax=Acidisoma silvae TaxID=2802396 RepID=A0A963YWC2_9PROT|nr:HAD family hydrolase [Acidisoma silvae]MCB8878422.1 HAD family hydrolase [Acidisoma silvae]